MQQSSFYSQLFKYKVFSKKLKQLKIDNLPKLIELAEQKKGKLICLFVEERANFEAIHLPKANILFVEEEVCLHQKLRKRITIKKDNKIVLCNKKFGLLEKQNLTLKSKWSSRFCLDSNFQEWDWELFQNQQIKNAAATFIYGSLEDIEGFIVLSLSKKILLIHLLEFENTAIAKALLKRAEQFAKENALEAIQIKTPRANKVLNDFLKTAKFKEQETRFVYHLWLN